MHNRYKELCALAATGQIDPQDWRSLQAHMKSCEECRGFLAEVSRITIESIPLTAGSRVEGEQVEPPAGIRNRFIERALAQGIECKPGDAGASNISPRQAQNDGADGFTSKNPVAMESSLHAWVPIPPMAPIHAVLTLVACIAFGFLGYLYGMAHRRAPSLAPVISVSRTIDPTKPSSSSTIVSDESVDAERASLEKKLVSVSNQLAATQTQRDELTLRVEDLAQKAATSAQFSEQFRQSVAELENANDQVAKLKAELDLAQHKLEQNDVILIAQQQATQEAKSKLASVEQELRKEQDLQSARNEIGDLISARNLHIVDVHDSEPGGKRQQAFGRIFYVEGRSLVFYAYDLALAGHSDKKVVFHVWGETAGVKETTHSLGILRNDDAGQARWILTFDDSKVLNKINAVYITAESRAKGDPEGRKVLYAFLGSPNHP